MHEAFVGTIQYMYQSTPGPESTTVIQCRQGDSAWLKSNINVSFAKKFTLKQVITALNKAIGYDSEPVYNKASATETSAAPLEATTDVRSVIAEVKKRFKVIISSRNNRLYVYPIGGSTGLESTTIEYLSAPPNLTGGGTESNWVEITCPYNPSIKPGDQVLFSASFYKTKALLSNSNKTITMNVQQLQFHFGTTSNANTMTLAGNVEENE